MIAAVGCERRYDFTLTTKNNGEPIKQMVLIINHATEWQMGGAAKGIEDSIMGRRKFPPNSIYTFVYTTNGTTWGTNSIDLTKRLKSSFDQELVLIINPDKGEITHELRKRR
jgi:hypothetical protein